MNYTLFFALLTCVAGMLSLCKNDIMDLGEWNGEYRTRTTERKYKLDIKKINDNEIMFSLYVNGIAKLRNATATLTDNDMAVYDDGNGFTLIMKLENGDISVTNDLRAPYDRFERVAG